MMSVERKFRLPYPAIKEIWRLFRNRGGTRETSKHTIELARPTTCPTPPISSPHDAHLVGRALLQLSDGVMITDARKRILEVNQAFSRITGYRREDVIGKSPSILSSSRHGRSFYRDMWKAIQLTGHWQGEIWNRRKDGEIYPEWLNIIAVQAEQGIDPHYLAIFSDLSHQEQVRSQIHYLSYYDRLTNLPNRQLFLDRLNTALSRARREAEKVGLFFLDLDRFRSINDSLGHSVGDRLLCLIGERLSSQLRHMDTIARLGGDEFTVVVSGLSNGSQVDVIARKILGCFQEPYTVKGHELFVTACLGLSLYPDHGADSETLLKHADIALNRAKKQGKNHFSVYERLMSAQRVERLALENQLRKALRADEIHVAYQPQMDISNGVIVGVEALARWKSRESGDIPPGKFIPIAEESGMIRQIGVLVLRTACAHMAEWRKCCRLSGHVAVNVSGQQLAYGDFTDELAAVLRETGLPPACLELEFTESELIEHAEHCIATIETLKAMGVGIAIDDFGTGYSSLSYLKRFSVDRLKIDQSFIRDLKEDINDSQIVRTIIDMAHGLNLRVTAEGVETEEQLDFLRNNGCTEAQGYLIAHPLPPEELLPFLESKAENQGLVES